VSTAQIITAWGGVRWPAEEAHLAGLISMVIHSSPDPYIGQAIDIGPINLKRPILKALTVRKMPRRWQRAYAEELEACSSLLAVYCSAGACRSGDDSSNLPLLCRRNSAALATSFRYSRIVSREIIQWTSE